MRNINQVAVAGRLTRDAEMRYSNSGSPITKFSVAVNDSKKNGDVWEDDPSFFNCVLFGKLGEAIAPKLTKGSQVFLAGKIKQNRWEKDGEKHSTVEIIVNDIEVITHEHSSTGQDNFRSDVPF